MGDVSGDALILTSPYMWSLTQCKAQLQNESNVLFPGSKMENIITETSMDGVFLYRSKQITMGIQYRASYDLHK
jgi:hypothetical protein